jgi:hypothetical protein
MDIKKAIPLIVIVTLLSVSGCQLLYDFWPAKVSKTSLEYTHRDPNRYSWINENVRLAKAVRAESSDVYISSQLELEYRANLNKERYKLVTDFLDTSISQAESERSSMIGTLQQPGWMLAGLLSLLPVGTYLAGYRTQRPEDYTEIEVQKLLSDVNSQKKS